MAENYSKMFANPELTNKENIHQNSKYGKYSNFEEMKKTNWNHEQLLQYLSASNSQSLIKPAWLKSWNSSVLLNKYANIGDYSQSQISQNKESNWQEDNQFVQKQQDTKFGTMSMLTNSSISGTHSIDLPLQASMNNNSSVASKAILALQEKIKSMEKENKLLREIVAKSSRDQNDTYQHHLEIEQIQSNHDDAIKTYQYREEDLLNKIQQLEESYSQMTAYTEAWNIRIKEMEKVIEKRMDPKDFAKLNSDIRIDSSKYSELQQRNEEYEQIITGSVFILFIYDLKWF